MTAAEAVPALVHLPEVASTNTWLTDEVERFSAEAEGASAAGRFFFDGDAVVTFRQSDGRGQRGNHWESAPDRNICMSLLLRPSKVPASSFFLLSEMVALGVCSLLEAYLPGAAVSVKWPNDIYVDERKICGILIENRLQGPQILYSVVGIGLNVNQERFESDAPNPVSMTQLTGRSYELTALAAELQARVLHVYRSASPERVRSAYRQRLYRRDGWHSFRDAAHGLFQARIVSVSEQGMLTLETSDGARRTYAFKEVSFVL